MSPCVPVAEATGACMKCLRSMQQVVNQDTTMIDMYDVCI